MSKNTKIIVMLVLAFAILAAYLFLTVKEVSIKTKVPQSSEEYNREVQEKIRKMEEAYKVDMKKFVVDSQAAIDDVSLDSTAKTNALLVQRENMKKMTVPAQFKDLHMNLFLLYSDLSIDNQEETGAVILEISNQLSQAKSSFDWLN